ncbi:enoyl-CoA hydratase-related protein, partial [Stenotrophomonas pictorum]
MSDTLLVQHERGVATLCLNRPELHNAFDAGLIATLTAALERVGADPEVRAVVLTGSGASFSAGADLQWMRAMASASQEENRTDSLALARLMRTLDELPKPTIARVHGASFGGGVGLVACCDIAIAVDGVRFGLTESRLGLLPAVISPYVIAAIGPRQARRWFATGEHFDATTARDIGLVHQVVPAAGLDAAVQAQLDL